MVGPGETVVRPNGVMVVDPFTDRYGDIGSSARASWPDGTEYVLVYADERGRDGEGRREWRDPARELPPPAAAHPAPANTSWKPVRSKIRRSTTTSSTVRR